MALLVAVSGYIYVRNTKASTALPSDINNDNIVNVLDLSLLLSSWGKSGVPADVNNDNVVNIFDLSILLNAWGKTTPTTSPTPVPSPISNPAPIATPPASEDHREYMHGVDLVKLGGKYMVLFSSNQYPPVQPPGDWIDDIYYSYIDLNNAAATFNPKPLVSAYMAQEPTSAAVNSADRLFVTSEDAEFSVDLDQTYGIWDNGLNKIVPYGAKLMPPQGGHSGHVAASGTQFLVSFSDGWVDGGGVDNLGTGDDVFAKIVVNNGVAGSMINTAVGTGTRDWWPIVAGSDANWLQVWQRYNTAGTGGGTVLGDIIDHTGKIVKQLTIYNNNKYYYHDVQYIPSLGMYLVVGSQNVSTNSGIAVLIDKQGNVISTTTGLPNTIREAHTIISDDGKTAVYPTDSGAAILDVTSSSVKLRKTASLNWNWDYMGTAGVFVSPTRVMFATGTQEGLKFLNIDL